MALAYQPPGVTVTETSDPSVSPLLAVPAALCLIGLSAGSIQQTNVVTLAGTDPSVIPGIPDDGVMSADSIISVLDAITPGNAPDGYDTTTDYIFDDDAHTIERKPGSRISDPGTVYVTYTYVPADYFVPIRLDNMQDIAARFGSAYDSTGTAINSPLTYAAAIAFENGASDVVLRPLAYNNAGTLQQPTNVQAADASVWATNYVALRDIEDINLIIPVVGQSQPNVGDSEQLAIIEALQDHIKFQADQGQLIMGITGEDASASNSVAQPATIEAHAETIRARYGGSVTEDLILISPSKFTRSLPSSGNDLIVGGQYVAAAVSGMLAAQPVSASLTRKAISGFTSVAMARSKAQMNTDASEGLCVIWQRGAVVQVRHGITLDNTTTAKREISVVRAKHRVMESVRATMEEQIIGQVIADGEATLVVATATSGVLDGLRTEGDIVDFSDVQARTKSFDPTVIEVRFSYRPAFPVNYIQVTFSLDLTNQDVTLPDTTQTDVATP